MNRRSQKPRRTRRAQHPVAAHSEAVGVDLVRLRFDAPVRCDPLPGQEGWLPSTARVCMLLRMSMIMWYAVVVDGGPQRREHVV
jgi:hypothetical protein